VHIKTDAAQYDVELLQTSTMRGPAAVAQTLYRETDESRDGSCKSCGERKALCADGGVLSRRSAVKRDRREIDRFRGRD
jgi:ribosome-associated heat shock protein Hsp15